MAKIPVKPLDSILEKYMSKWQVVILKPAERYLNSLSESDRNKLLDALRMLQENPLDRKYKKLKGRAE